MCYPTTRNQLVIALEPECDALYVRLQEDKHGAFKSLNYGIVDCGGGTVDIAYHGIEGHEECNFVLNELDPPFLCSDWIGSHDTPELLMKL